MFGILGIKLPRLNWGLRLLLLPADPMEGVSNKFPFVFMHFMVSLLPLAAISMAIALPIVIAMSVKLVPKSIPSVVVVFIRLPMFIVAEIELLGEAVVADCVADEAVVVVVVSCCWRML